MLKYIIAFCSMAVTLTISAQEVQPRTVPVNEQDSRDDDILRSIQKDLFSDNTISDNGKSIQITVKDGVVVLMGVAKDDLEKSKIESIVRRTYGVTNVISKILVGYRPKKEP